MPPRDVHYFEVKEEDRNDNSITIWLPPHVLKAQSDRTTCGLIQGKM